jgi:peptide/nickel transport system substrate-binding protein
MWEKRILMIFTIIFLIFLGLFVRKIYYQNTIPGPVAGGKITVAEVGDPSSLNPIFAKTPQDLDVTNLVFSGLFYFDTKGNLQPDLVSSWEVSSDNKSYTFHLLKNAKWQDGNPVTSDDFIFTASTISDQNYNGPLKGLFSNVIFQRIDDQTFKINLTEPYAPFLGELTFGLIPSHVLSNIPVTEMEQNNFNTNPVGCGPYKFKNADLNSKTKQVVLERNGDYANKSRVPFISNISFNYYSDYNSAYNAYKSGSVSFLSDIPHQNIVDAKSNKDLNLYKLYPSSYVSLFFNMTQNNLKDKNVRTAIANAINKNNIINKDLSGQAQELTGPILPEDIGYTSSVKIYPFDDTAAKNTLKNAGYSTGKDGIFQKNGIKLEFNLVTSDNQDYINVANTIKDELNNIGIKVKVNSFDNLTLQTDYISPRKYDMILLGENYGADSDPYAYWDSSQIGPNSYNLSQYSVKQVDELIEDARMSSDPNIRKNDYTQFQQIITEDVPAIFLYRPYNYFGSNTSMKGASSAYVVSTDDKFFEISNWYLKIGRTKKK